MDERNKNTLEPTQTAIQQTNGLQSSPNNRLPEALNATKKTTSKLILAVVIGILFTTIVSFATYRHFIPKKSKATTDQKLTTNTTTSQQNSNFKQPSSFDFTYNIDSVSKSLTEDLTYGEVAYQFVDFPGLMLIGGLESESFASDKVTTEGSAIQLAHYFGEYYFPVEGTRKDIETLAVNNSQVEGHVSSYLVEAKNNTSKMPISALVFTLKSTKKPYFAVVMGGSTTSTSDTKLKINNFVSSIVAK